MSSIENIDKSGRSPDYDLAALDKQTNEKGKVGVAWLNSDGSISIKLNMYTTIPANSNLLLTLFKRTPFKPRKTKAKEHD